MHTNGGVGGRVRDDALDDVAVLHLLEEGDLADGGGGDAIVLLLEAGLLERDGLVGGPLPDLLHLLVLRARTRA